MADNAGHDDYEGFQWIGEEAFYTTQKDKRRMTKEDAIYGVFAEEEEETRPKRPRDRRSHATRGAVSFVSSGRVQEGEVARDTVEITLPRSAPAEPTPAETTPESDATSLPASFGQKIRDGALKRQREEKEKEEIQQAWKEAGQTGFASFEQHSRGIASKLMQKMGYKPGEGLGARKQGMVDPLVQKMRPKSMGMGYGDFKEQGPELDHAADAKPQEEPEVPEKRPRLWRASTAKERRKRSFRTAEEVLQETEEAWKAPVLPTILDMRGPKARVLTDLAKLNEDRPDEARPMPELQHNMDLLVEMTENEIKNVHAKLKTTEDMAVLMEKEEQRLLDEMEERQQEIDRRLELQSRFETQIRPLDPITEYDALLQASQELQTAFSVEYKACKVPVLLLDKVLPYFEALYRNWQPFEDGERGREEMRAWKGLLSLPLASKSSLEEDCFGLLMVCTMMPPLRSAIVNIWRPRDPEPLLTLLDLWRYLFPQQLMRYVCEALAFPKLKAEVERWEPRSDALPVHTWIHPWLIWMPAKLRQLYPAILHKLTAALQNWKPSDASALVLLRPWKTVFDEEQWTSLLSKAILPRLEHSLQDYEVDPLTHDVSTVENVVAWQEVAPAKDLAALLDVCFFPKWIRVLHHWLTHSPNLEEVSAWYLSWKGVFPQVILDAPKVANHLSTALDCMNRAAEGLPIPSLEMLVREEEIDFKKQSRTAGASPKRAKETFTLRDMVQSFAEEKNISFVPKPKRMHEGLQVYSFGGVSVVLDIAQNGIRGQFGQTWKPLSLEQLFLEAQRRSK